MTVSRSQRATNDAFSGLRRSERPRLSGSATSLSQVSDVGNTAHTPSAALPVAVPVTPTMSTLRSRETDRVTTGNVTLRPPCGTTTTAGTVTAESLLDTRTSVPPVPATRSSDNVAFDVPPPMSERGSSTRLTIVTAAGAGLAGDGAAGVVAHQASPGD